MKSFPYCELQHEKELGEYSEVHVEKQWKSCLSGNLSTLGNLFWVSLIFMCFNLKI